jgi:hypothetical protein
VGQRINVASIDVASSPRVVAHRFTTGASPPPYSRARFIASSSYAYSYSSSASRPCAKGSIAVADRARWDDS